MLSEEQAIIEVRKLRDANKRNSLGKSIEILLNLIAKLQKENIQLKKQIDLMAEYINNIQDCPLENCSIDLDCENNCNNDEKTTKKCWIKYFETKAKKGE